MEIDEVDDDDVDYNLSPDASGNDICNIGASGDEGGKDELLLKLQQYVTSDANFTRWVYPLFIFFFFFFFSFLLQRCSVVKSLIELAYANIFFSSIIHLEILFDSSAYPYIIRVFLRVQYGQVEECDRMTRAKRAYIRNEACSPCLVCMKERKLIGTVNEHVC